MNNDSREVSGPPATNENGIEHVAIDADANGARPTNQQSTSETTKDEAKVNNHAVTTNEDGKSDSEAETVVMPGKEEGSSNVPKKAIKHESSNRAKSQPHRSTDDGQPSKARKDGNDGKHKKTNALVETNNSSNLSSTRSSPSRDQDPRPVSRANSDTNSSKTKLSHDSDGYSRGLGTRKRKITADEPEEKLQRRRAKRERRSEERSVTETRKASNARSESPARQRPRALSTQSSNPGNTQKRRKPPPLVVGHKRRTPDDSDSNGSRSPRMSAPPKRSAALDDALLPKSHKKLRDKNGRTLLARACAAEEVDSVVSRLNDRPEDLDEEDNAGNTPLQIAALEGNDEIVKVLIKHGCKTDCMNSDKDTPLIDAVENSHLEVVRLLLKAGVNPRQVNAKGEEPIDLVDIDHENGKSIKAVLEKATERHDRRRQSEDIRLPNTGKESMSGRSPRESPSLHSARSPPPPTSRRRPARSEPSRNDLLWLNPTPERLREKAGMGDDQAVLHILEMKPMADAEAVLAAAKGGHELCLSFLFAIGKANPDPDPLRGSKEGLNTPMLVAIGRNNIGVLKLLLDQPSFDPTRRVFRKLTYHELAQERRGVDWEEEVKLLKFAYDKHRDRHGNKSPGAVRQSPSGRDGKKLLREKVLTSPLRAAQKSNGSTLTKDSAGRKRAVIEGRNGHVRKEREKVGLERTSESSKKHLEVPDHDKREDSTAVSDREASPLSAVNGEKKRSLSDAEKDAPKPRKRLISRKDLNDRERKRRNSLLSVGSSSSNQDHIRATLTKDQVRPKIKRDKESDTKLEVSTAKKRARRSDTPPDGRTLASPKQSDLKETKRPRVNSDSKIQDKNPKPSSLGPARVAKMSTAPSSSGAAPVAFMGSSKASQSKVSKDSPGTREPTASPVLSGKSRTISETKSSPKEAQNISIQSPKLAEAQGQPDIEQTIKREDTSEGSNLISDTSKITKDSPATTLLEVHKAQDAQVSQEAEKRKQEADEMERLKVQHEKEEAERLRKQREEEEAALLKQKHEEEEALREKQRQEAEAEAAALQRQREQEEEAARLQRLKEAEEEAERHRQKLAEEEAARLKKKREEQEEAVRLKKKREEDQERQRLQRQQEEERRRRDKLPKALCVAADLGLKAKSPEEILYWLPLMTVTAGQLDPTCTVSASSEQWVTNIQVAPILGLSDLDLSQCKLFPS